MGVSRQSNDAIICSLREPLPPSDIGAMSMRDGISHSLNPYLWSQAQTQSNDIGEQSCGMDNISE